MTGAEVHFRMAVWTAEDLVGKSTFEARQWCKERIKEFPILRHKDGSTTMDAAIQAKAGETIKATLVSYVFVMLDNPFVGQNKVNVVEVPPNAGDKVTPTDKYDTFKTGNYDRVGGQDYEMDTKVKLECKYYVQKGNKSLATLKFINRA